jgi:3',5'-nucleoside bisphosphate phosphatase
VQLLRADLHTHTWVSDGDVAPAELVRLAEAARLDIIALTDHDTAAGVPEAVAAAEGRPIRVIPGIEISTRWSDHEIHVLGYWIDPSSASILAHQVSATERRFRRMEAMLDRLQGMGVSLSMDEVQAAAGTGVRTLGRPHLARALHTAGYTRFYSEAFGRFIGDGGPAFVAEGFPEPAAGIDVIHQAGGVAVWAHPAPARFDEFLPLMKTWGIDGVECYRPGMDPKDVASFEAGARRSGLFLTGGSDWHGPQRFTLGEFAVAADRIAEVLAFGGILV